MQFKRGKSLVISVLVVDLLCFACGSSPEANAWRAASSKDTIGSLEDYLAAYPAGSHREEAMDRLKKLGVVELEGTVNALVAYDGSSPPTMLLVLERGFPLTIRTSNETKFVNIERKGGDVTWIMDDTARYRMRGVVSSTGFVVHYAEKLPTR